MNTFIKYILLFGSFLFCFANCNDEDILINNTNDFEIYLQEEMEDQAIPAMAVLIFEGSDILYENYKGQSQIEQNIALQNDHLFLLASVSKVITATALLQLYEDGAFDLDDPINDYLSFDVNVPDYTTDITFRMLLTHTSGIEDSDDASNGSYFYGEDSPVELSDFMEQYLSPTGTNYNASNNFYDFEPGTESEYTNMGNALIGVLVEQISGIDFNTYCKQHIFNPLGMSSTAWRLDEISQTIVQPYDYSNGNYELIEHYTFTDYPNGGLRSTPRDLSIFFGAFAQGGTINNYELLTSTTISEMLTPQIPTIDAEMGLHLFLIDGTNNLWGHNGGEQGVSTVVAFNPTTKVGAIILTNHEDAELDEILVEAYKFGLTL